MIEFPFNFDRAAQSMAFLLQLTEDGSMDYFRILKLAYMADREYLINRRMKIIGGVVEAMPHGPVIVKLRELIKGRGEEQKRWDSFFVTDNKTLRLVKNPGLGDLSLAHAKTLGKVFLDNKGLSSLAVEEKTHTFDEWKKRSADNDKTITFLDILNAAGKTDWENVVTSNIEDEQYLAALYGV